MDVRAVEPETTPRKRRASKFTAAVVVGTVVQHHDFNVHG